ncbi:hypothetical protein GCM10027167_63880 [Nocardia heshunensis]
MVLVLGAAATVTGYVLTRPGADPFAVGNCVRLDVANVPSGNPCDDSGSLYSVLGRENIAYPLDSACMKYEKATRAIAAGTKPDQVLCLKPTRANLTDPGALAAGDCVAVTDAGATITRLPCGTASSAKVLGVELHARVPVTDHACANMPRPRMAFAQESLGGRALVVCADAVDPADLTSAQYGDCSDRAETKVRCTDPAAVERVLTVETVYRKPAATECPNLAGADTAVTRGNDRTDLTALICLGPIDRHDSRYAMFYDCMDDRSTAADTHIVACTDPGAAFTVIDRHDADNKVCPPHTDRTLSYVPGTTPGLTICLRRK